MSDIMPCGCDTSELDDCPHYSHPKNLLCNCPYNEGGFLERWLCPSHGIVIQVHKKKEEI